MSKKFLRASCLTGAALIFLFLFSACEEEAPIVITAPSIALDLPASLTNAAPAATARTGEPLINATSHDGPDCNFGNESDPFGNGYGMTKFLVGLSQSQSCFADFLISIITTQAQPWINQGLIQVGDGTADDPTFVQITQSTDGSAFSLWLYFDLAGVTPSLYLTWNTAAAGDVTGRMIWLFSENTAATSEPDAARVDFVRTATTATNEVFIRFPTANNDAIEGFRVDVTATGSGAAATFEARGLLAFGGQWDPASLPTGQTFKDPSLAMVTVSDATGLGASIADLQDLALHIQNVDATNANNSWSLGSYQYTVSDKSYFTALGADEWRHKGISKANYVNIGGTNTRSGTLVNAVLLCLESASVCGAGADAFGGWNLNAEPGVTTRYFTDVCTDTDGADCKAFMQGLYDQGWMGATPNSSAAEPSADFRQADLAAAVQLTGAELWPLGTTSTTAFAIPLP